MAEETFVVVKVCGTCDKIRPMSDFYTGMGTCKECRSAIVGRHAANKNKRKDIRNWIKLNPSLHPHRGYPCACPDDLCINTIGPRDRCQCMPMTGCTSCASVWVEEPTRRGISNGVV